MNNKANSQLNFGKIILNVEQLLGEPPVNVGISPPSPKMRSVVGGPSDSVASGPVSLLRQLSEHQAEDEPEPLPAGILPKNRKIYEVEEYVPADRETQEARKKYNRKVEAADRRCRFNIYRAEKNPTIRQKPEPVLESYCPFTPLASLILKPPPEQQQQKRVIDGPIKLCDYKGSSYIIHTDQQGDLYAYHFQDAINVSPELFRVLKKPPESMKATVDERNVLLSLERSTTLFRNSPALLCNSPDSASVSRGKGEAFQR